MVPNHSTHHICDKDLVAEKEILKVKLREVNKENTSRSGEFKNLSVLLNPIVQTSFHDFKICTKEWLLQVNFDTLIDSLTFKWILPKIIC